jgi:hypothetical protein
MGRMSHAFGCTHWNVQDFKEKPFLNASRLDVHGDISTYIVSENELVTFFRKKLSLIGWKVKPCDLLNVEDCEGILKLYEIVYVHPPSNGDYSGIFFKGQLAKRNLLQ